MEFKSKKKTSPVTNYQKTAYNITLSFKLEKQKKNPYITLYVFKNRYMQRFGKHLSGTFNEKLGQIPEHERSGHCNYRISIYLISAVYKIIKKKRPVYLYRLIP